MHRFTIFAAAVALAALCGCRTVEQQQQPQQPLRVIGENQDMIRWWPRLKPAVMPKNLKQFVTLEFMDSLKLEGDVTVSVTLPKGIEYDSFVTAWANPDKPYVSACPAPEESAYPVEAEQRGDTLTMKFPAGAFDKPEHTWLTLVLNVGDLPVGPAAVKVQVDTAANQLYTEEFTLDIRPELSGMRSHTPLIVWNFQGLDDKFIPIYMDGMVKAGANRFYEMREETPGHTAVVDYQEQFDTIHGTAFFGERIAKYFEKNGLPEELKGRTDIVYDNAWLLDNPDVMEPMLRDYYKYLMDGKNFQVIIYDAERGAFKKRGKEIVGDLTEYSLKKFGSLFNIADEELSPEVIAAKYQNEWTRYCCLQSMQLAKSANKIAKKYYPGSTFEVYSGYEYDASPNENLTRMTYAVDWKKMREAEMDAAGCGYFGSPEEIAHTAEAVNGVCPMLPAEMYMEGFRTPGVPAPRLNVENFAFRLIESYLAGGGHGIQLWYGAVMHGGALTALDIYTKFENQTSGFLDGAKRVETASVAKVTPKQAEVYVHCFEKNGKTMVIVLNPTDKSSVTRLIFKNREVRPTVVKLEPFSYNVRIM
ncbi:MAG: hypothetical protein PHI85_00785 [Victivallaceae bacterium]|nr:hypothetical protein [Victivallaceae bacterium]